MKRSKNAPAGRRKGGHPKNDWLRNTERDLQIYSTFAQGISFEMSYVDAKGRAAHLHKIDPADVARAIKRFRLNRGAICFDGGVEIAIDASKEEFEQEAVEKAKFFYDFCRRVKSLPARLALIKTREYLAQTGYPLAVPKLRQFLIEAGMDEVAAADFKQPRRKESKPRRRTEGTKKGSTSPEALSEALKRWRR